MNKQYCSHLYEYHRLATREVRVGSIGIGGENPIRIQSMTTTDTMDTMATVKQTLRMVESGCELVRITAPSKRHAENLAEIKQELAKRGCHVPLIADIHFTPNAAEVAARIVEKVRVNPGNYVDRKKFEQIEYSDAEYQEEIERIYERFSPLVKICKEHGTAMRIGTNHGSLSDRIMSRYGDTPMGMVVSALEFVDICEDLNYHNLILSMKASNTQVMVQAYRLLVHELMKRQHMYPLHLGVTEAGEGEDGRLKSAVGIGTLLMDGLGDTVRVSLTEDPEFEAPVAKYIVDYYRGLAHEKTNIPNEAGPLNPFEHKRQHEELPLIVGNAPGADILENDLTDKYQVVVLNQAEDMHRVRREIHQQLEQGSSRPVIFDVRHLRVVPGEKISEQASYQLSLACLLGPFMIDGLLDGIWVNNEEEVQTSLSLLQAGRLRTVKTEYISCPSCGRTLFDLQQTTAKVRAKTNHLKGLKIAVMGCIVNGPGEMADADYGYVGSGPGKITLYKGQQVVEKNIDSEFAVDRLVEIIKQNGQWVDL